MRKLLPLVLLVAVVSSACGDPNLIRSENEDSDDAFEEYFDPDVPANTVEIAPETYVEPGLHLRPGVNIFQIMPELNGDLEIDNEGGALTVRGQALDEIDGIEVGDILMTEVLLARVAAINRRDDNVFLRMEDFQIWEVVHGQWELSIPLNGSANALYDIDQDDYMVRRQMLSQTFGLGISASYRGLKISSSASLTMSAQPHLRFEGKIPFYSSSSNYECEDPQIKADIGCLGGRCAKRYRYCVDYLMMNIEMGADYTSNATLTAEIKDSLKAPEEKRMSETPLGQIPLAGPFTLRPSLYVDRQAYIQASAETTSTAPRLKTTPSPVPLPTRS